MSVHREGDNLNSIINHFHKVLDEFISIIKIGCALAEITSHKPQNFSVFSRNLYALEVHGNSQSEDILRLEMMCSFHHLQLNLTFKVY